MNIENPATLFKHFRLPIDYGNTKEQEPPFLVYTGSGSNNLAADNYVYHNTYNYTIEYYFRYKDESLEKEIEDLFRENEIAWYKSNDIYIREDEIYVIYYNI